MDSSSEISRSMARIFAFVSSLRWASLTLSRYFAISSSILSLMLSYFSIREYSLLNSCSLLPLLSSFFEADTSSSSCTMPNMRCMRSENDCISFCASSTESSGVFMKPAVMKCRRKSSSSSCFFGLITQHTNFSICGMNQMRIKALITLKLVWKAASVMVSFCAMGVLLMSVPIISAPVPTTLLMTKSMNGRKIISIQSTPNTLKNMWARAARRACVLADMAARFDVMVVPMFSPSTSAIPW